MTGWAWAAAYLTASAITTAGACRAAHILKRRSTR